MKIKIKYYNFQLWILAPLKLYTVHSGITNNASESMNNVIKRLIDWKEVPVDVAVLSFFDLQNYYWNECLRRLCSTGNYRLKSQFISCRRPSSEIDNGDDPTQLTYVHLRKHLHDSLCAGTIDRFTSTHTRRLKTINRKYQAAVYCICRGIDLGELMLGCDQCKKWYHPPCMFPAPLVAPDPWYCPLCK